MLLVYVCGGVGTIQVARLALSHLRATMQSVFQATFWGLGYGTGGLASGG